MIRDDDIAIEIGYSDQGLFVRLTHKVTKSQRYADGISEQDVGRVIATFKKQLLAEILGDNDVRVDLCLTSGGDVLRVTHLPSGFSREGLCREGHTAVSLIDDLLEELWRRKS